MSIPGGIGRWGMANLDICPIFCSFFLKALLKCLDGKAILYIISCIRNISFLLHLKKLTPPALSRTKIDYFLWKREGGNSFLQKLCWRIHDAFIVSTFIYLCHRFRHLVQLSMFVTLFAVPIDTKNYQEFCKISQKH